MCEAYSAYLSDVAGETRRRKEIVEFLHPPNVSALPRDPVTVPVFGIPDHQSTGHDPILGQSK